MTPIRITIIQEVFTDYRKAIFDLLNEDYTIQVIHGSQSRSSLNTINASYSRICRISRFGSLIYIHCFRAIITFKPKVIIHQGSPGIISLPLVWLLGKVFGIKFVIWTHGYERTQGFHPEKSFRSKIRLIYFKMSDAIIFYTKTRKTFFEEYLREQKLFYAMNTLDSDAYGKFRDGLMKLGVQGIKKELGWNTKFNLVYIGRLLSEKLPEHLIQAYLLFTDSVRRNTSLHFIGDGELFDYLKNKYAANENILFYGAKYETALTAKYLFAADAMVIPGYLGLSVVHAFLMNTPVITYQQGINGPFHSPEIEYLKNGFNGLLVEPYNCELLAKEIEKLLTQNGLLNQLRANIEATIQDFSIYKMKEGFDHCIQYVLTSH